MMNTTPAQRTEETRSPRNHIAAKVVNTKLSAVSGQRKLMSLSAMRISRQAKNSASKNTPSSTLGLVTPALTTRTISATLTCLDLADLRDSFLEEDHAGRFEDQPDKENEKQFGHITNPGSESA